jgi:hypothetical protein
MAKSNGATQNIGQMSISSDKDMADQLEAKGRQYLQAAAVIRGEGTISTTRNTSNSGGSKRGRPSKRGRGRPRKEAPATASE